MHTCLLLTIIEFDQVDRHLIILIVCLFLNYLYTRSDRVVSLLKQTTASPSSWFRIFWLTLFFFDICSDLLFLLLHDIYFARRWATDPSLKTHAEQSVIIHLLPPTRGNAASVWSLICILIFRCCESHLRLAHLRFSDIVPYLYYSLHLLINIDWPVIKTHRI